MAQKSGELQYKVEGVTKTLSLFDEKTGDLKSTYQIFDELKENWEKMSNAEKQELAINSAGKNQFEVFVAELDRFTAVRKAYGLAVNDNNMAEKENARYMESISAKISLFQNQLQELILGNGGLSFLVKGFLDATNAILKFANSGIGQFIIKATLLKTAITGATTAFNMLKASAKVTALIETIQQVGQLTKDYGLLTGILRAYIIAKQQDTVTSATNTGAKTAETGATVALTEAESALNIMQQAQADSAGASAVATGIDTGAKVTATGATTTLTMAQEALNLAMESNPVMLIITGLVALAGVTYGVAKAIDANRESVEDLNEESDKHLEKANKVKTKVEELTREYDENCKKIEELKSQEATLGKTDYTNQLNSLKTQNALLADQIKLQKEIEEREKRKAADKKWQALNKVDNTKEYLTYGTGAPEEDGEFHTGSTLDQVRDQRRALDTILSDYNKFSNQYLEAQKAGNEEGQKQAQKHLEQLKQNAKDQEEDLLETSKTLLEDLKVFTDETTGEPLKGKEKEYNELSNLISQVTDSTDEYNNILGTLSGTSSEATSANDALASATSSAGDSATDAKDKFAELSDQLSKSVSNMDSVVDAYKTLKSAISEYNSKGKLSYSTLKSLLSLNPKYLSALSVQNGKLKLNEKALKAQWEQEKKNAKSEIEASGILGKLAGKEKDVGDKANSANPKVSAFGNNIESSGDKASSASGGLQTYQNKIDDISGSAKNGINFINSFGRALSRLSGLKLSMKQVKKTVPMFDFNSQISDPNWQSGGTRKSSKNKNKNKHKGKSSTSEQSVTDVLFNHVDWNDEPMPSGGGGGSSRHSHSGGGGGSSSSGKERAEEARRKAEEKKKKEQEKKLREAKQALNKVIRASIKEIDDETNAYKKNYKWQQKQLKIAKKKEKQLKDQKTTYENVKKYIDEMYDSEINKLKDVEDEFQNLVQKERDALEHDVTIKDKDGKTETVKKNYVEIGRILEKAKSDLDVLTDGYDRAISRQERLQRNDQSIKNKEKEIKDLEAELKEKQKINDEEERKIQLQELQNALDKAKSMRVKVYRKGEGFVYGQDQDAINEAQKNLNDYLRQKEETDIQDKIDKAQEELDSLNKVYEDEIQRQEDLKQKAEDSYHDQYDVLQGWYDDTTAKYEDYLDYRTEYKVHSEKLDKDITTSEVLNSKKRIENLEKEKKKFDELWDAEEKKRHEKLVKELTNLKSAELGEQESYDNRIKIFEKFVSDYENLASRLEKAEKKVTKQQNKVDSAKTAYDFQKDQDKSQKEALGKIKDKTDKAKTTKEVKKNKKAVEALTEYQKAIDKSQHELYSKVKKGSMTTNQAIEEYNMWARHWYNYYNLEKYGIPFTYSATGVYTQGKASMFGGKKATGDASIKQNGIYLVGDSPNTELVIGSKLNGVPMNLQQGTGVVNAKSTRTLAGMLNSIGMMKKNDIGTLNKTTNNNDNFSIGNVTVNGAKINDGKSFANELLNLKAEMLQSAYRR